MAHPANERDSHRFPDLDFKMPALFIGHGNPMNAIEDTAFSRAWASMAQALPTPKAILCVSAHWETAGTKVTAMAAPMTIHDVAGFPKPLFEQRYAAPGSPEWAGFIRASVAGFPVELDEEWGIDHGAWSVLCRMYPKADIPVLQLSLDRHKTPEQHYALGKALAALRRKGVLIIGSGNIVHNLRALTWKDDALDWAIAFDEAIKRLIWAQDHAGMLGYLGLGEMARLSVPTAEHFLPLLYILALQDAEAWGGVLFGTLRSAKNFTEPRAG